MAFGVAASLSLLPLNAQAQDNKLEHKGANLTSEMLAPMKLTPAERKAKLAESVAKHPLLHKRIMPNMAKRDSLVRLNRNIEAGIKVKQSSALPILRANDEKAKTLWGNVLFDNSWGAETPEYGMYSFSTETPIKVKKQFLDDFFRATGAGAWIEDDLYFVMYQNFWGVDMIYLYHYDTKTWEMKQEKRLENYSLVAIETAVANDGTVYGCFLDADGTYNELGVVDYATESRTTIGRLRNSYVAMGITSDNVLYGIAEDGNLYKIDTQTAEEVVVGSTGKQLTKADGSYFYQSGEIDQTTNTFYWDCVDNNQQSTLYTVNLTTGQLTEVGQFANNNIISLLTIPKAKAADNAPAAVEQIDFDFTGGSLTGNICFTAPTKQFDGNNLTDSKLTYTILNGKEEIATGETTPGAKVSQQVTLNKGYNTITVIVSNANGASPKCASRYYAGFDTPKSVGNAQTSVNANTGKATVTWEAPAGGQNDGYLGELTYDIKRYPEGKVVKTGHVGTTFEETLPEGETTVYGYGITPSNNGTKGDEIVTNYIAYGDPITPPFYNGFDAKYDLAYFTVMDADNDGKTWSLKEADMFNGYDGYAQILRGEEKHSFNDWLITPALKVKANHKYNISFRLSGLYKYYEEQFEVKYGTAPTVEGMNKTLMPQTTIKRSDFETVTLTLEADKDEVIYLGFHALSVLGEAMGVKIDDINVTAGVDNLAPDQVTELNVEADPQGTLSTKISFTAPTKTLNGNTLDNITGFQLRRTGKVVAEIPAAAPGAKVEYTDNTPVNGVNVYSVAAVNEKGASFYCTPVAVYVGEDSPTTPVKANTETNTNSVRFNWNAPEKGIHGGYLNPEKLTYTLAESDGSDYKPTYTPVGNTVGKTYFDLDVNPNDGAEQTVKTLFINAANDYGSSAYIPLPSYIQGKPYDIPFSASVKNYMFYGILWAAWGTGKSDFELSKNTVDNDGGCFYLVPKNDDDISYLGSGKINLGGATAPKLMFHHKAAEGSKAKITVEVETPDGIKHEAGVIDYANLQGGDWSASGIDLSPWANEPFITFDFAVQGKSYEEIYIDRLFVRDTQTDDLNAEIETPKTVLKGGVANVKVRVNNFGENPAKNFKVKLYANDKLVETKKITETLDAYRFTDVDFAFQSNKLDQNDNVELKAEIDYAYDLFEDDNVVSANIGYTTSAKPKPEQVNTNNTEEGVNISWTPVITNTETVTESFEDGTSWSQDNFGAFHSEAVNSGTTGGVFDKYKFPNQGSNYGFMLFEPANGWLTAAQLNQASDFKAHTGDKYIAALYRVDAEGYDMAQNNWLYSPELSGDAQEISFWAKNFKDSEVTHKETFNVLYSTTDNKRESFNKIGETFSLTSGAWEEIKVQLPAGAKYFAINHNTATWDNPFFFMIDDITYSYGAGKVTGYNIYRDGKLIGNVTADVRNFVDKDANLSDTNSHVYGVTAVYASEESEATLAQILTGLDNISADSKTFDVYTTDGICVAKGVKNLNLLKKGVYVVNGKKIAVK